MPYRVDYALQAGPHCRLALFMGDNNVDGAPVFNRMTMDDIYRRPFSSVLQRYLLALPIAAVTVDTDLGAVQTFIDPPKAVNATAIITTYLATNPAWLARTMEDLITNGRHPGETENDVGSLLHVLCANGVYVPCSHASADAYDTLKYPRFFPLLWAAQFPDPAAGGALTAFPSLTFRQLFTQQASNVSSQTRQLILMARGLGILRPCLAKPHCAPPYPIRILQQDGGGQFVDGGNYKCCFSGVCTRDLADPADYCEVVTGGGCNSMSDPC
ncbi:MAG: hypothetical protein SGI88_21785 [Candidatus Hydrogenedentes bacterium]|nr:hypothetical protein [Candidatus Hydrogenedentota bacterium]